MQSHHTRHGATENYAKVFQIRRTDSCRNTANYEFSGLHTSGIEDFGVLDVTQRCWVVPDVLKNRNAFSLKDTIKPEDEGTASFRNVHGRPRQEVRWRSAGPCLGTLRAAAPPQIPHSTQKMRRIMKCSYIPGPSAALNMKPTAVIYGIIGILRPVLHTYCLHRKHPEHPTPQDGFPGASPFAQSNT